MGNISRFDLIDMRRKYGVYHFVETGTGAGDSLEHAAKLKYRGDGVFMNHTPVPLFSTLRSCEIDKLMALRASKRFYRESRVHIFSDKSDVFLEWACRMLPCDEPILFWLDAHFPGADKGFGGEAGFGDESDVNVRLPLETELNRIKWCRPGMAGRDVIICDDLRIYKDGPFQSGNVPPDVRPACPRERNIDFVYRIMGETHDIQELYEHEGYILMTPKVQS